MLLDHVADHSDALTIETGEFFSESQATRPDGRDKEFIEFQFRRFGWQWRGDAVGAARSKDCCDKQWE